jgi:hypothetical protein
MPRISLEVLHTYCLIASFRFLKISRDYGGMPVLIHFTKFDIRGLPLIISEAKIQCSVFTARRASGEFSRG